MISGPGRRFLSGTDMTWTTALSGTWMPGPKVDINVLLIACRLIQSLLLNFYSLGDFAVPDSMKKEYGIN